MVICSCEAKLDLSRTIQLESAVSSLHSENNVSEFKSTFLVRSNFAPICSFQAICRYKTKIDLSSAIWLKLLRYLSQRIGLWTLNLPQGRNAPWTELLILCNRTFQSCRAERKYAHDYVQFQKGFFQGFFHRVNQYLRVCNSMFLTRLDKCKYHRV